MPLIDLSQPVSTGMPVYPGDPEVQLSLALSVAADGVDVHEMHLGSHSGTHLDAPAHSIVGGRTVDRIPLDLLCGPAVILQTNTPRPHSEITLADVFSQLPAKLPEIVCIATGWDTHFSDELATQHPHLSADLTAELWSRGARVLGVDMLSPDPTDISSPRMPVHEQWLGADGVIVENLAHLRQLPLHCELSLFPLLLHGVDGSPIRAVARVPESTH